MTHSSALRRAVVLVCAVALLTVGFAHSIRHFAEPVSTVALQADVGAPEAVPDAPKKAPIAIEHCHGCEMIAIVALAQCIVPDRVAADLPLRRFDESRPHPPLPETPPPIVAI